MVASDDLRGALSVDILGISKASRFSRIDSDDQGLLKEVSALWDLSDMGSPRTDDHEYLELPGIPEDPYSDPEADPEEDDDEDPEEDHVDYPADRGDAREREDGVDTVIITRGDGAVRDLTSSAATPPPHPAYRCRDS
ncbi:hypothetical protein Tco_0556987 [Tanacetum coccineum]